MKFALLGAGLLMFSGAAYAQTSFVQPNIVGGGYTITTPGQPSTFVQPNIVGGGYSINTPGRPSTFVEPNIGGGYTITTPGQPQPRPYGRY